jgi:hypothetical protein
MVSFGGREKSFPAWETINHHHHHHHHHHHPTLVVYHQLHHLCLQ